MKKKHPNTGKCHQINRDKQSACARLSMASYQKAKEEREMLEKTSLGDIIH